MLIILVYVQSPEDTLMNRKFSKHDWKENCGDVDIILPKVGSKIEFENITKQMKVSYCIITDFESYKTEFNQKKG